MSHPESTLSRLALQAASQGLKTLAPAQAWTLTPRHSAVLRMARGGVWATRRGPHPGTAEGGPQGDLLLAPGERLHLAAGESVVLEPIGLNGQPAGLVAFEYCNARDAEPLQWDRAVARPASELAEALRHAGHALTRLTRPARLFGAAPGAAPTKPVLTDHGPACPEHQRPQGPEGLASLS